jgi:hypothetical protein
VLLGAQEKSPRAIPAVAASVDQREIMRRKMPELSAHVQPRRGA